MKYICTFKDQEGMISTFGLGDTIEEAIDNFFHELDDQDFEDLEGSVEYEVFEQAILKDFFCNNLRGVYLDGILEDLFDLFFNEVGNER